MFFFAASGILYLYLTETRATMDQSLQFAIDNGFPLARRNVKDTEDFLLVSVMDLGDVDEVDLVQHLQRSPQDKNVNIYPGNRLLQCCNQSRAKVNTEIARPIFMQ